MGEKLNFSFFLFFYSLSCSRSRLSEHKARPQSTSTVITHTINLNRILSLNAKNEIHEFGAFE